MLRWLFRILIFGLGVVVLYWFGGNVAQTLWHRVSGTTVQGEVVGFATRGSQTIQSKGTGTRMGRRRARRPVFTYPVAAGSTDSLTAKNPTGTFFAFAQYDLHEPVTVVFDPKDPQNARIFGVMPLITSLLLCAFGLYMLFIGLSGRLG